MPITPGTHVPAYATKPADGACYLIKFLDAAERAAVLIVDDLKGLQPQD
jgi:hypothetical protein